MKSFPEFCKEAYDAEFRSGAQIVRTGEGGRTGRDRRLTNPERRRANPYKPRKDIGTKRETSDREQQPTQERGSADVAARAAAAAKAERIAAAKKRAAAKSGGETPTPKARSRDLDKAGLALVSKRKSTEVDKRPADQPKRPPKRKVPVGPEYEGLTPREADKIYKRKVKSAGKKLLKSINPRIKDDEQSKKANA